MSRQEKSCYNCVWLSLDPPSGYAFCDIHGCFPRKEPCESWKFGDTYQQQKQKEEAEYQKKLVEEKWRKYAERKVKEYVNGNDSG